MPSADLNIHRHLVVRTTRGDRALPVRDMRWGAADVHPPGAASPLGELSRKRKFVPCVTFEAWPPR